MNQSLTIFTALVSAILLATASVAYGDEIQDEPRVRFEVHGVVYSTVLDTNRIIGTGKIVDGKAPVGVGLCVAAEKAQGAFEKLKIPSEAGWILHSVQRQFYLEEAAFYKCTFRERTNLHHPVHRGEFHMFVLLDGTVLPVKDEKQQAEPQR